MKRKHFILALVAMLWSFSFSAYADDVIKVSNWAELKAALEANDGVQRSAARQRSTAMRTSGTASITEADFTGGMSVQLTGDCVGEGYVEIKKSGTTILDLNGFTIKGLEDGAHAYPIVNYGKLLIKDTNEEKEGTIYCGIMNGMDATGIANTSATFMMTGGHIICTHTDDDQAAIVNYGNAVIAGGIVEANGNALLNKEGAPLLDVRTGALITGEVKDDAGTLKVGDNVYTVAKIGDTRYGSLEAAINAAVDDDVIVLVKDVTGDVTITQKADVDVTIDGDGKTFTGVMTIDGANRHTGAETLTIKNVVFQAVDGKRECIASATGNAYAHNVTIEGCTFKGNDTYSKDNTFAIRFPSGGVGYDLTVQNCTADDKMFGLLWVTQVVGELIVDNCTAEGVTEGIVLTNTTKATITKTTIDASNVAIRAGQAGAADGTVNDFRFGNNTLKSDNIAIQIRGNATDANLSMTQNVVSGTTHISGNTADTKIAADANYWDGKSAPVVAEGSPAINVNSYYADEALTDLVRNEMGSITPGYTTTDRIYGEAQGNAVTSFVVKVLNANNEVMGTATLKKPELINGNVFVSWYIRLNGESSGSWNVAWTAAPAIDNMPAKVQLFVDGAQVSENNVQLNQSDDLNKINAAVLKEDSKTITAFYTTFEAAVAAGNNVAILTAGTYKVPTGKNLTITGAVDGVEFDNIGACNMGDANVTFNNVTFDYYPNVNYTGLQHSGNLVYNNCTINGQVFLYGQSETFNECTFNQNSADAYNVWTYGAKEVAFNECTFNSAGKSVLVYAEGENIFNDITVSNTTFNASQSVEGKAAIEMDASLTAGANVTITSSTATGFGTGNVSGNSLWNNKMGNADNANNDITVVVDGNIVLSPHYEAQIGDVKHRTLKEAIDAVQNGETITLVSDITYTDYVYASGKTTAVNIANGKDFTLDLAGKSITGTNATENNYELITIAKGTKLTIEDSSAEKTGKISYTGTRATADGWMRRCHTIYNQGTLVLNGGTIENNTPATAEAVASAIDNNASWGKEGYLTVNGGTVISASYYAVRTDVNTHNTTANGTLKAQTTFNGGTVYGFYLMDRGSDLSNMPVNTVEFSVGDAATIKPCEYNGQALRFRVNAKSAYDLTVSENATVEGTIKGAVTKIGNKYYAYLQDAIDACTAGDNTITLRENVTEDVVITQLEGVNVVIDGDNKTFTGLMTVFGNGRQSGAETLAIKNINFVAKAGADACIVSPDRAVNNKYSYAHNVTVENCTFTDPDGVVNCAAIRHNDGGDKNWTVKSCTVDATMHSLLQVNNVEGKLIVENCTVNSKNGLNLNSCTNVELTNNTIEVKGYAVRTGVNSGGNLGEAKTYVFNNNTLKTDNSEGDAVIVFRASTVDANLSMTENVVSGTTHISGNTAATKLAIDANYWDGEEAPVATTEVRVNSYYADAELQNLISNHYGEDFIGYTGEDRIWGEVWGNAFESFVIKALDANGNVMGTTSLNNVNGIINGNVRVTWNLLFDAASNQDEYWTMQWTTAPTIVNMPASVELWVDGVKVGSGPVQLNRPDNLEVKTVAITKDGNIKAFHTSFANAYAAANADEVIVLLEDVNATEVILIEKSVTIDGKGHKVTSNATRVFRATTSNTEITLNDVNMVSTAVRVGTNDIRGISVDNVQNVKLTLNNCSVDFTDASASDWAYGVNVTGGNNHIITINGGTYEGANVVNIWGENNTVNIDGATLNSLYGYNDYYWAYCVRLNENEDTHTVSVKNTTFNGNHAEALDAAGNLVEENNTDNTVRCVAKVGDTYYSSVNEAINAAADGATVQLLVGTIDEYIKSAGDKSITIQGYNHYDQGLYTLLTGGMMIGVDNSKCNANTVVVKNLKFTGKGLIVASQENVTIENNVFENITGLVATSGTANENAISVVGKNVKAVVKNNTISDVKVAGINLRNTLTATVEGNSISGTAHNSLQITSQEDATNSTATVLNNTLSDWGLGGEGRAMRINGIVTATVNGNVMSHATAAPEEFVKITGTAAENIDASQNYWAGENPFGTGKFATDQTSDPAAMLISYYTDAEKQNLMTISSSIARIGNVYYTTFADALANVQDGETIYLNNVEGTESGEIDYTENISFIITGNAPKYLLPVVTFQNATVTIKDATIKTPELDARQDATINVVNSTVYDGGGNSIVKSYYNGAINIDETSTVYTMQVTTMGYINVKGTLNAVWQTNVYGNGMITVTDGAKFNTAALQLTAKEYSGRDNTDAERVGKPATIIVDGATLTAGKVFSSNGADYSYQSSYGINVGTIADKSAVLDIKNGGTVNIYMADGQTANIGADGTVNVNASTFNVACRAADGTVTLDNAGTVNVSGASNLAAAKVTGNGWFYMNGVSLDADTKLLGAKVRFASGENTVDGSTIDNGLFQVGIGAYNGVDANVDTENGVVVNVKNNAKIGSKDGAYAGWVGTGFYDADDQKAAAMTTAKYVLNIENSIAEFGYLHVSNDGELNVNGVPANKAHYNNSDYAFRAGDFIINGTANFTGTDVLAFYTKVSCDNGTDKPGTLNINAGTEYEAERHNGAVATDSNFTLYKSGVVNVAEGADLQACEASSIAADAALNIAGSVTALGTVANNGAINFTSDVATLTTATTGLTIGYNVDPDKKVVYADGAYKVVAKDYVAYIGEQGYESLAEALTAAANGETVSLSWSEGDPAIAMNGAVFGKSVTITGTANVDWSKGWFFVGRGGEGNATVTFDNANLTSASSNSNSGLGIHVSGREKDTDNKYDGTLVIKNSTIDLDYLINRGAITVDDATLTVKKGFGIAGRPASETESGADATATITLENNAKLVVNNHNGMGLGQAATVLEGYGVMNVNSGSTFETTQAFNVSAKGQMNVNGGTVKITGNLANNGTVYVAGASTLDAAVTGDGWFYMNGVTLGADTKLNGAKVAFINGDNTVKGSTLKDGWFSVGIGQNAAAATAAAFAQANGITLGDVTVNVSENATVYTSTDAAYSGWVGSAYSAEKDAHKYILNITNSLARFGYMHVSKDGELNATGHSDNKYEYAGNTVDFYAGTFINNGTVTLSGVDAWAMYSKISVDHAGSVLNIVNGTKYMSNCTTGNVNDNTFLYHKAGTVNVDETSSVNIEKATTFVEGAVLNIAGNVTAKGAITGNGAINFTAMGATLAAQEGLTINHPFGGGYQVERIDGVYRISHYVASVNGVNYESLEAALKALTDGANLTLLEDITVTEAWDCRSNGALVTAANVTINGDGKTLKLTGAVNDANWNTVFRFEGDNATVKNLTIDASETTDIQRGISSMLSIKVDSCKLIGKGNGYAIIFGEGAGDALANVVATVTRSEFENWSKGVSDNANGQDAKKVTINDNRFTNASVNVSASESVTFNHNVVADGDVIITSYTNAEDVYVEATGSNVLDIDRENVIHTNPANMYVQREFTTPVASIGTSYYLTLQEAVNAGGEVVVLTNVNLSEAVAVENKTVVLNLNNNTIVPAAGATMTGGPIRLLDGANLTINGEGEISNNGNENVYAAVSVLGNDVKLTVNGGKLTGYYYGIAGNGYKTGTEVTINGGVITSGASDGLGIYHPQAGILKVIDGEITGATGIYFKGGKLDIQGGTIKGTGVSVDYEYNGSGCVATGDALVIENAEANGYAAIESVSITGGTFIAEDVDAAPIASYAPEAADALVEFLGENCSALFNNDNIDESLLAVRYQLKDEDGDGFFGVKYTNHREHLTIVDNAYTEFVNEAELSVGTLTYERTIPTDGVEEWHTLYVPFEIPVEALNALGYEAAFFYDVHFEVGAGGIINPASAPDVHLIKINQGTLKANFPYVIRPSKDANLNLSLVLENTTLFTTAEDKMNSVESGSTINRFIFAGTYKKAKRAELTGDNDIPCYAVTPWGTWQKMSQTANLGAFRVFMYIVNKDGSPVILNDVAAESIRMRVIGEENEDGTTTIYDVEADEQSVDYIYDLQGRRVLEPQKGGLYIVNGKKVVF